MCIGLNFLAVKGDDDVYSDDKNSWHSDLINQRGLKNDILINRSFVSIEVWPLGSLTSVDLADWQFKVDEERTLPSWFEDEKTMWETRAKDRAIEIMKRVNKTGVFTGYLDLQGTRVKDLGKLKECGYLDLQDTQVEEIKGIEKFKDKIRVY